MIVGTRRTEEAGGGRRCDEEANTSRFPTDSNDDTIAIATRASIAALASRGRSPSSWASVSSNVITRRAR